MVLNKEDPNYRQCSISVMDNIADPDITFDENGICNYFYEYHKAEQNHVVKGDEGLRECDLILQKIKRQGKNKKYNCITGVSGGVDSSFVVLKAKEFGLNPLVVHFDNGWNAEIANNNIQNIIEKTGFDLYTLVVDWMEFRDLQRSYFKANVVDLEALTDHAIICTLYKLANKLGIKYILSGSNIFTEQVLPKSWIWKKHDSVNIRSIHKTFGEVPLKTYPLLSSINLLYFNLFVKIRVINLLDYLDYNKLEAKIEIKNKLGWTDYGGKHCESVFTRFYQGYILPVKFKIDKRKAHLSTLIFSKQITKKEAQKELDLPIYDKHLLKVDYEFVRKKLGFSEEEFDRYFSELRVEHKFYLFEKDNIWDNYPILKLLRPILKILKSLK